MMMIRIGECNKCGQCCGAEGSPNQDNPWPESWPESLRHWSLDDVKKMWPQSVMFGITQLDEGLVGYRSSTGSYRIKGTLYYYVWIPGHAVCKDTSIAHDGSSYSLECPFLGDDPGDGTRPCVLVGTQDDGAFKKACEPQPPLQKSAEMVVLWQEWHPLCSYTWSEE